MTKSINKNNSYVIPGLWNIIVLFSLISLFFISCKKEEAETYLTVSPTEINIPAEGGSVHFMIETNASSWSINNPQQDIIKLSSTEGNGAKEIVEVEVATKTLIEINETLTINADNATPVNVIIKQQASEYLYSLSVNASSFQFNSDYSTASIQITSSSSEWAINCNSDWVSFSQTTGGVGVFHIDISVSDNVDEDVRSAIFTITADNSNTVEVSLSQLAPIYPNYNISPIAPDNTGMESNAVQLAGKIKIGWNIGNTLEAIGGETAWGNPKVTEELIELVKQNGFNAIRIPCSWNQYMENESTAQIKTEWLNRVKQVVKYCVDNDMYVILNIHWDQGWLENNCTEDKQVENNAKQKAFWQQIATHLRDFDEHLIFAGSNEPNVDTATEMEVLMSYHQTFIDAVRSTGGKNSYRVLVVQGPSTDIERTNTLMTTMPSDEVKDRLMAEIHYYTPYQFCLMTENADWGKMFYYWGSGYHSATDTEHNTSWGEESTIDDFLGSMKTKFVDKGIPVIMGEFAVIKRNLSGDNLDLHLASRAYYLKYLMQKAKENGILPFYWDAGNIGANASALFNRTNNTVYDQQAIDALMEGISD